MNTFGSINIITNKYDKKDFCSQIRRTELKCLYRVLLRHKYGIVQTYMS